MRKWPNYRDNRPWEKDGNRILQKRGGSSFRETLLWHHNCCVKGTENRIWSSGVVCSGKLGKSLHWQHITLHCSVLKIDPTRAAAVSLCAKKSSRLHKPIQYVTGRGDVSAALHNEIWTANRSGWRQHQYDSVYCCHGCREKSFSRILRANHWNVCLWQQADVVGKACYGDQTETIID